jgi:hypothetical protein
MTNFFIELFTTLHGWITVIFSLLTIAYPLIVKNKHGSESIQSGAVSLGIFGTFCGVALGLATFAFDKDSIDKSIELLIGGLKVAFITPIIGLGVSLAVKHTNLYKIKEDIEDKSEAGMLIHLLRAIEKNSESVNRMSNSISGDGDSTLYTQIQKLRTGMLDKQEELNEAFKNFAEKMAEDNASTFIKALEKAMQEFNDNLTKTVGANFVRLNEGIENMLVWQDKYKDQINTSNLQLNTIKTSLEVSEKIVSEVIGHAKSFSNTSDKLDNTLKSLYDTQVRIEGGMLSFDEVSKGAKENFSMVSEGFDVLKKSFTEVVDSTIKANNDNLTKVIASITTHKEKIDKELVSLYSATSKKIDDTVDSATTKTSGMVTKNIKDVLDFNQQSNIELKNAMINIQKEMSERITAFKAQMQKMGEDINKTLADNVSTMDTATKSTINNLGKSLTSIAEYMSDKLDKK